MGGRFDLAAAIASGVAPAEPARSIEAVTAEVLGLKRQGGQVILELGRRLIEAKEMLTHGEWLPWLSEQVDISERTAQKFMRLAREWSNPNTLADLGASKALMLLALPEEERDAMAEDPQVIDMSARELAEAIRERDEARKAAEEARADAAAAEQARARMEADMTAAKGLLEGAQAEKRRADQEAARLTRELEELKSRPVEVAVEPVADQEALAQARAEAEAGMQARLDQARAAQEQAEAQRKAAEEALEEARRKLDEQAKAEQRAVMAADKDTALFEALFAQSQELANKMQGLLLKARGREDQTAARSMERALKALGERIGRCGV